MTRVREWKPGDIGAVSGERVIYTDNDLSPWTWVLTGAPAHNQERVSKEVRPLAVIDFEDREQVERLRNLFFAEFDKDERRLRINGWQDAMQAALREFATPTPPKPEEPTGLGAVVEDVNGWLWMRGKSSSHLVWIDPNADFANRHWGQIDAVKVLSDGIPA